MAKRMQEQKEGDNRIVAKSKPTKINLAVSVSTISNSPIASKSPGLLKAPCRTDWSSTGKLVARELNRDAPSRSQGWQKDAVLDVSTRRLVATEEEDQEHLNFPQDSESMRRLFDSGNSEIEGKDKIWPHHLHVSTDCVPHMEKVFLDRETKIWSQSDGSNERPRCEHSYMGYIYVCYSSSCSSSWTRLYGNFAIYQESTLEV